MPITHTAQCLATLGRCVCDARTDNRPIAPTERIPFMGEWLDNVLTSGPAHPSPDRDDWMPFLSWLCDTFDGYGLIRSPADLICMMREPWKYADAYAIFKAESETPPE